jgi:uncharacterized repeat protein (TIGR04138 family)
MSWTGATRAPTTTTVSTRTRIAAGDDATMNLRDQLARVIARDSRYRIEGYAFVLESLKLARHRKLKGRRKQQEQARAPRPRKRSASTKAGSAPPADPGHVTGSELCLAARQLALRYFGGMALLVLDEWGIRSTSDIGEIVFNLIASGDLDKTAEDKRSDFDNVFDFATALRPKLLREPEGSG